jgi:hypothetical protein
MLSSFAVNNRFAPQRAGTLWGLTASVHVWEKIMASVTLAAVGMKLMKHWQFLGECSGMLADSSEARIWPNG